MKNIKNWMRTDSGEKIWADLVDQAYSEPMQSAIFYADKRMKAMTRVCDAADYLVSILNEIVNRDDYKGVFISAHVHGVHYDGPTFEQELKYLTDALSELRYK